MTWVAERSIKQGNLEALIDRNTETEEIRVGVYKGDTLLTIDFIPTVEVRIETAFAKAKALAPSFSNGVRQSDGD